MHLAWANDVRKLRIQSDSQAAVAMLSDVDNNCHQCDELSDQFSQLKNCDWEVTIKHIYHKATDASTYLANFGQLLDLGTMLFLFKFSNCPFAHIRFYWC
ncbi:hypothetical protein LINPERPRIM_LOCUS21098 [Linum perenne]